jgi:dTDP-4-dehydrorhamnose 3,5-epimerase
MTKFTKIQTKIKDVYHIQTKIFGDNRGSFMESYNQKEFAEIGMKMKFVQDNLVTSTKGVLRGLHFQYPHPQGKLIRVIKGKIYDVAVDLRKDSPTFLKYEGVILSEENREMLYVPEEFAHGYLCLTDDVIVAYKVTDFYHAEHDKGIRWDDKEIAIDWPLNEYSIEEIDLSEKDERLPYLKDIEIPF